MGVIPVLTSSFGDSGSNLRVQTLLRMFVWDDGGYSPVMAYGCSRAVPLVLEVWSCVKL